MKWLRPEYQHGNLVNLMGSIVASGGGHSAYPPLDRLAPSQIQANDRVVLFVLDGLGYEYVTHQSGGFLREHTHAPLHSVFPSTTATAISTFASGLAPRQHGLTGWFTYLAALGAVTAVLPFQARCGNVNFGRGVIDARAVFNWTPVYDLLDRNAFIVLPENISESTYSVATSGRAQRLSYESLEGMFACVLKLLKQETKRTFIYAYWPSFDSLAHQFGVNSDRLAKHYSELDRAFAAFALDVDRYSTLVLVTADHGLIDTAPDRVIHLEDHPELASCLLLPLCGEPRVAYCYLRSGMRQTFVSYIETHLAHACRAEPSHELLEQGYFGTGATHPDLTRRIGDFVLLMKENYVIKDCLLGESRFSQVGVHGGLTSTEMTVPLINLYA